MSDSPFDDAKAIGQRISSLVLRPDVDESIAPQDDAALTYAQNTLPPSAIPKDDSDPYSDIEIAGLSSSVIASGEHFNDGIVQLYGSNNKPILNLDLDIADDPRYQRCLEEALILRKKYPLAGLNPSNPADYETIINYEKIITERLTKKIHQEYGDYNKEVAKELTKSDLGTFLMKTPSLHNEISRFDDSNAKPVNMSEFNKGELICVHYASLMSSLSTEAGIKNFLVVGHEQELSTKGDVTGDGEHMYVVSRNTGAILEATSDDSNDSYRPRANPISIQEFLAGKPIATVTGKGVYIYDTHYTGDNAQTEVLGDRLKSIKKGNFLSLPVDNTYTSDDVHAYDISMAVSANRKIKFLGGMLPSYGSWANTSEDPDAFKESSESLDMSSLLAPSPTPEAHTSKAQTRTK